MSYFSSGPVGSGLRVAVCPEAIAIEAMKEAKVKMVVDEKVQDLISNYVEYVVYVAALVRPCDVERTTECVRDSRF